MNRQRILQDAIKSILPEVDGVQWNTEINTMVGGKHRIHLLATIDVNNIEDEGHLVLSKIHQCISAGQIRLELEK